MSRITLQVPALISLHFSFIIMNVANVMKDFNQFQVPLAIELND